MMSIGFKEEFDIDGLREQLRRIEPCYEGNKVAVGKVRIPDDADQRSC